MFAVSVLLRRFGAAARAADGADGAPGELPLTPRRQQVVVMQWNVLAVGLQDDAFIPGTMPDAEHMRAAAVAFSAAKDAYLATEHGRERLLAELEAASRMCTDFKVFSGTDPKRKVNPGKPLFPQLSKFLDKLPGRVRRENALVLHLRELAAGMLREGTSAGGAVDWLTEVERRCEEHFAEMYAFTRRVSAIGRSISEVGADVVTLQELDFLNLNIVRKLPLSEDATPQGWRVYRPESGWDKMYDIRFAPKGGTSVSRMVRKKKGMQTVGFDQPDGVAIGVLRSRYQIVQGSERVFDVSPPSGASGKDPLLCVTIRPVAVSSDDQDFVICTAHLAAGANEQGRQDRRAMRAKIADVVQLNVARGSTVIFVADTNEDNFAFPPPPGTEAEALFTAANNDGPRRQHATTNKIRGTYSQQLHKIGEAARGAIDNAYVAYAAGTAAPTLALDLPAYTRPVPPLLNPGRLHHEQLLLPYMPKGAAAAADVQCASDHVPLIFTVGLPTRPGADGGGSGV